MKSAIYIRNNLRQKKKFFEVLWHSNSKDSRQIKIQMWAEYIPIIDF